MTGAGGADAGGAPGIDRPWRILHCHSSFDPGGKEARAVELMNAAGDRAVHSIVSGVASAMGAADQVADGIGVDYPGAAFPPLTGPPGIGRYRALADAMRAHDLVLTYNWGAMDAVGAHRLATLMPGGPQTIPPLVHHEDGFNDDEQVRLKPLRGRWRRWVLPTARRVVVPSMALEAVARAVWRLDAPRLVRIGNGVDVAAYADPPDAASLHPALVPRPGRVLVGAVAGLRAVKQLGDLVDAVALCPDRVHLVLVGDGPERTALEARIAARGLSGRATLTGFLGDPARWIGAIDIIALSSMSEQQPISIIEGMAASRAIAAYDVGDIGQMVSRENAPFVTARDPAALAGAIRVLAGDAALRARIGAANRAAAARFDRATMQAAYAKAYGTPGLFGP